MNNEIMNHGNPPETNFSQVVPLVAFDTILYGASQALAPAEAFQWGIAKNEQYQNVNLKEVAKYNAVTLIGMKVSFMMKFTAVGTQTDVSMQKYFENHSSIKFVMNGVDWYAMPLSVFCPYERVWIPDGTNTFVPRGDSSYFIFDQPIEIPSTGNFSLKWVPASGLITGADAPTNPMLPNAGLTNDRGWWIKFEFIGSYKRILA